MQLKRCFQRFLWSLSLIGAAAHAQSSAPAALADCMDIQAATTSKTPIELWRSIPTCVKEDKYNEASFMYGLAGSLGAFDAMRVKDVSAHQAAGILPMAGMLAMGPEMGRSFRQKMQERFADPSERLKLCNSYKAMPAPTYFPQYMIGHGLASMADKPSDPLVKSFDAPEHWQKAIDSYMQCPKTND
jgi:hypothetical protein